MFFSGANGCFESWAPGCKTHANALAHTFTSMSIIIVWLAGGLSEEVISEAGVCLDLSTHAHTRWVL